MPATPVFGTFVDVVISECGVGHCSGMVGCGCVPSVFHDLRMYLFQHFIAFF